MIDLKKLCSTLIINCLLVFLIAVSCSTENTPVYKLTTSSNPAEGGTVSPDEGEHDEGEEVQITATPNEHWVFQQWQGGHSGSQNPATLTMDSDKSVTAKFVKQEYPLSVTIEGEGTVDEQVIQQKSTDYPHGTVVELTANPAEGWEFVEWQGDLTGSENPETITIDGEVSVTAVFQEAEYSVSITIDGEGSYSMTPEKESYKYGDEIELSINPVEGWNFVYWNGDLEGTENPITVTVENDIAVAAVLDNSPFSGGDGSEMYPYQISSLQQLQQIHNYSNRNFIQTNNIDATESKNWNDGRGFIPIGDDALPFEGIYNGNNFEINHLEINDDIRAGLFAEIGENGIIKNLKIKNINYKVHAGGGITGNNHGLIKDCTISGEIEAKSNGQGGVAGTNNGIIDNIKSTVNLFTITESNNPVNAVGGIAGGNTGDILNSESTGLIQGNSSVGGISGYNTRLISNSVFKGKILGGSRTGGVTGGNNGIIKNSGAEAEIKWVDGRYSLDYDFGGIAGENEGSIENSYFLGDIYGQVNIGGLVGTNDGEIKESYTNAEMTGSSIVGGAIGRNIENGEIENIYSLSNVSGDEKVGGLIGVNRDDAIISTSFSNGEVSGNEDVAGLIGVNGATVQESYWDTALSNNNQGVGRGSEDGVSGLNTSQMQGSAAQENMPEFDWNSVWKTVKGDYPILRWQEE